VSNRIFFSRVLFILTSTLLFFLPLCKVSYFFSFIFSAFVAHRFLFDSVIPPVSLMTSLFCNYFLQTSTLTKILAGPPYSRTLLSLFRLFLYRFFLLIFSPGPQQPFPHVFHHFAARHFTFPLTSSVFFWARFIQFPLRYLSSLQGLFWGYQYPLRVIIILLADSLANLNCPLTCCRQQNQLPNYLAH